MIKFSDFLVEQTEAEPETKKLKHLPHVEDMVFSGHEGVGVAAQHLEDTHNLLLGKRSQSHISTKYDGCLHADTAILMADGTTKRIADIVAGWSLAHKPSILSLNEENNVVPTPVVDVLHTSAPKKWYKVELEGGYITLTADHQVATQRGWVEAKNLRPDDEVIHIDP